MSGEQTLKKSYPLNFNVEVGKYTVVVADTSVNANGCAVPAGANAANPLGVVQNSIIPSGFSDYANGVYTTVSGTAWPAGAYGSGLNRKVQVVKSGICQAMAASAINRGDHVNIADSQGRIKTINEASGVTVYEVGIAEEACLNAGDIIRIMVNLTKHPV